MHPAIAVLMQLRPGRSQHTPVDADFGRARALLRDEGVPVVVAAPGDVAVTPAGVTVGGWQPGEGRWEPAPRRPLLAAYNRLPSRDPAAHAALTEALAQRGIPLGNPPAVNRLALDKRAAGEALAAAGLPVPETETEPGRFAARLAAWGAAFVKPRHGALGRGVHWVDRPSRLAAALADDALRGDEPLLQRAVAPLSPDCAGACVRSFLQRTPDGGWCCAGRVARVSRGDRVANVSRGAQAAPLPELEQNYLAAEGAADLLERYEPLVPPVLERAAGANAGQVLEVGLDWVIDAAGDPWLIEINGKPLGKLRELARRVGPDGPFFAELHHEALLRPFRRLRTLATGAT